MTLDKALDIANWTGDVAPDRFDAWKAAGISTVIPQAIDPPAGYPPSRTVSQGQRTLDAGLYLVFYLWLWMGIADPIGDLRRKLDLIAPFAGKAMRLALDVEDNTVPAPDQGGDANRYADLVAQALGVLAEYPTILGDVALYSGPWYWLRWLANTWRFKDSNPLWPADYNGNADDVNAFEWFGGWSTAIYHQFLGTSTVAGVGNVDQNVISAVESAAMAAAIANPTQPQPDLNPLVVPFAYVADVVVADALNAELARKQKNGQYLPARRNVLQQIVVETQRIRTESLGARPGAKGVALDGASRILRAQPGDLAATIEQFNRRMARRVPYRPAA